MNRILLVLTLAATLVTCNGNENAEPSTDPNTAEYQVEFQLDWNKDDYPVDYPSNDHFSALIGWSHATSSEFFQEGTLASEGIKRMAELGSTSTLSAEINTRIANNEGLELTTGSGLGSGVGVITVSVNVSEAFPAITLSSMVAPSPDWYVAIVNINLLENGVFVDEKSVPIEVYDAGTDSGTTYTSANAITSPQSPIGLLTAPPLGNGSIVNPIIGTAVITRIK